MKKIILLALLFVSIGSLSCYMFIQRTPQTTLSPEKVKDLGIKVYIGRFSASCDGKYYYASNGAVYRYNSVDGSSTIYRKTEVNIYQMFF